MKRVPVGPYSYAILQALKASAEALSRPLLARVLHEQFTPPIRPLLPVLSKLEGAGLVETYNRASRSGSGRRVDVWALAPGAAWRLKNFTKTTADDLT